MNIAIDIRCLMERELTGVSEYTLNLLTQLFHEDNTNHYYLFYNSRHNVEAVIPRFSQPNVHYCPFHFPNKLLNRCLTIFHYPQLNKLIERRYKTPPLDLFFFPNLAYFSTTCPYIITAHDLSFTLFPEFLSLKRKIWHRIVNRRRQYQRAKQVLAVSKNTRHDLITQFHLPPAQITTILSGITPNFRVLPPQHPGLAKIKRKYNLPDNFFLFLGTIEPRKNLETLITAFASFQRDNPDDTHSLVIVGKIGWKSNKTLQAVKSFNQTHPNQIILTNFIKPTEKVFFYNLATLFVYPSFYEGFGFPPLEAMACGCPVVTSNNSSLSEICADAAILIDPTNANDIKTGIQEALTNKTLFQTRGLARATAFSWEKTAHHFLSLILDNSDRQ